MNYMGLACVHLQAETVIGGNTRITSRKDMDNFARLMDKDTKGNTSRVTVTGMECTDGQVEKYIMGNKNTIREMVMAIIGGQMEMKSSESTRMIRVGERQS